MTDKTIPSTRKNRAAAGKASTGMMAPAAPAIVTKAASVTRLLERDEGATIAQMMEMTGWQAHSVRGFMAGALKKQGRIVSSDKVDDTRTYRLAAAE